MSEALFAALLAAALLALTATATPTAASRRLCAIAGLLSGACVLTRTAGLAVVAAGVSWLLMRRRWADATTFVVSAGVLATPWGLWVAAHADSVVDPYYTSSPYGSWNIVFSYTWPEKLRVLTTNLAFSAITPAQFWGLEKYAVVLGLSLVFVVPIVLRGLWLTRAQAATWCVAVVTAMNLMWVWPPARFYFPIAPLVLWQASVAMRRVPPMASAVLVSVVAAGGFLATLDVAAHAQTAGTVSWHARYTEDWSRLSPLLEWVKHQTPSTAVVTGNLDPAYFLFSGRPAVRAFTPDSYALFYGAPGSTRAPLGSVEDFRRRLLQARVDYCIWSPAPGFSETPHLRRLLDGLVQAYPGSLRVVAGREDDGYAVYFVDRARLAAAVTDPAP